MNREQRIANYLLALFGALSLAALSLPLSAPVRAFKAVAAYLFDPVPFLGARAVDRLAGLPPAVAALLATDVENQRLKAQMRRLALIETELRSARLENSRLREALGMKPAGGTAVRWAKVLERDPLNWHRVLLLGLGREEGAEPGAPVLGLERGRLGAVGRITEAGGRWSKVNLLTDELSSVAAYNPSKQWEGLVVGLGGPRLKMNYLPLEAEVRVGDPVYTSATSATFPPDILVGTVFRVLPRDPHLTFQAVELKPAIEASALKEVLVLRPARFDAAAAPQASAPAAPPRAAAGAAVAAAGARGEEVRRP